jgi:hypothetical protein
MIALLLLLDVYAAPDGKASNAGTKEAPWDLASALTRDLEPGTTLWVRGGEYRGKFEVKLRGTSEKPVVVRGTPGERASILDSGLRVVAPAEHVWIRDLEIAGTAPVEKRVTAQKGSWPSDLPGTGGLEIQAGKGCKFINLVIHDNLLGGVGWWVGSTDSELYGCLIYNNGWKGPDRDHGHCVYAQNRDGVKTIAACVMSVPAWGGSYTMHAYGSSKAYVDHFVIEDNIAYERGTFLVGGGRPSRGLRVARNYLHKVGMRIGYGAPENEDVELLDNVAPAGLDLKPFKKVVESGNVRQLPAAKVVWIPNKYDSDRAHVAIYNGAKAEAVEVDVPWPARLLDPKDVYGKPLVAGEGKLRVPMAGEFAAFVAFKE